jgi:hypothetical protein
MNQNIPRFLVFGENIEDKLQFISSMKNCSKLYDMYINDINAPFIEYGYMTTLNDIPCQAIFILCPDILYTDELMKNDYFKNIVSYIICCNYEQSVYKLQQYNQLISKHSIYTYNDMYIWFIYKNKDDILLTIRNADSFIFSDNLHINKIIETIQIYYNSMMLDNDTDHTCTIL